MRTYIRAARPSDQEAVFEFVEHTWEWGDYIPDVWDIWFTEPRAKLFVATVNGVPVGIEHVFVNGQLAVRNGKRTGAVAGKMLRRP